MPPGRTLIMRLILITMPRQKRPDSERTRPDLLAAASSKRGKPWRAASDDLLGEAGELIIMHGEREYRLRRTASGKLILTA